MSLPPSPHPLFDPIWYRGINRDLPPDRVTFAHYLSDGWRRSKSPHPLFSVEYYLHNRPDVRKAGLEPLTHFVTVGWKEGSNPHPAFDVKRYLPQVPNLAGLDPLTHYLTTGWKSGFNPTPVSLPIDIDGWLVLGEGSMSIHTFGVVRHLQSQVVLGQTSSFELHEMFEKLVRRMDHPPRHDFDGLRPDLEDFDEEAYIASYPDIKNAVEHRAIPSGRSHWLSTGFYEERKGSRDGSWRQALSLQALKAMIVSVLLERRDAPPEDAETRLPKPVIRHVKRWNKVFRLVKALPDPPLISVLLPVFNVDVAWLNLAIESVYWQIYDNWELCIVDDCSSNIEIVALLRQWADREPRIKVKLRTENGHISAATNDALAMATGTFVALLDHDDELTVDALAHVADHVNKHKDVDFIYSDEDKVDELGNVHGRFFKPDWSPEFILSCGYTTHLSVYRRAVVMAVGGFRSAYDGAQDYDLTLRVASETKKIGHIPEVLYHWRTVATSTASGNQAKNYALPRAKAALKEHMTRMGFPGEVRDGIIPGYTRPLFTIKGEPLISLIIPTAGKVTDVKGRKVNLLRNFVESIESLSTWKRYQIVVIENGNLSVETMADLEKRGTLIVPYREENFNLARKINLGVERADGDYVVILNDDMQVITPDWIEQLLQFQQQKGVGVVGAKLLFADRTIQHVGVSVIGGNPGHPYYGMPEDTIGHGGICTAVHNAVAVTGACSMTPKRLFMDVGGYDNDFKLNYNDVDYCLRLIGAGYRVVVNPFAVLWHYEALSKEDGSALRSEEIALFHARWRDRYQRETYMRGV